MSAVFALFRDIVRQIPAGRVATYGPTAPWTWSTANGTPLRDRKNA